jgi:aquaporin Z
VTLAALVRGRIGLPDTIGYWIAQLVGGLLAMALARWVIRPAQVHTLALSGHALSAAFIAELVFTIALCYVVLNVATSKDHPTNSFYGLAIGFTVLTGAIAVGGLSGGVFNPAVTSAVRPSVCSPGPPCGPTWCPEALLRPPMGSSGRLC